MKEQAKGLLLQTTISQEMKRIGYKLSFYKLLPPEQTMSWESKNPLRLERVLKSVTAEEFNNFPELKGLCCLGWEFVWGEKPPAYVESEREKLLEKVKSGMPLSYFENLWLKLIAGDTDLF